MRSSAWLCELSSQRKRVIWGEGNPSDSLLILLDNPGAREDRENNPFVCGTRETFQHGLAEAGIGLDDVYVTYLLKCRPVRGYDKPLARESCRVHLNMQLREKTPQLLLGLGDMVVKFITADEEASVKSVRQQWHEVQGMPAAFSYHPLAVRRRPVLMRYFAEDLKLIADKWKGMKG